MLVALGFLEFYCHTRHFFPRQVTPGYCMGDARCDSQNSYVTQKKLRSYYGDSKVLQFLGIFGNALLQISIIPCDLLSNFLTTNTVLMVWNQRYIELVPFIWGLEGTLED